MYVFIYIPNIQGFGVLEGLCAGEAEAAEEDAQTEDAVAEASHQGAGEAELQGDEDGARRL